jgi:Domain of unknown function (DUF5703)
VPIGDGDLAANVSREQNGDLVLPVSRADAWTEHNKFVKLGICVVCIPVSKRKAECCAAA